MATCAGAVAKADVGTAKSFHTTSLQAHLRALNDHLKLGSPIACSAPIQYRVRASSNAPHRWYHEKLIKVGRGK